MMKFRIKKLKIIKSNPKQYSIYKNQHKRIFNIKATRTNSGVNPPIHGPAGSVYSTVSMPFTRELLATIFERSSGKMQ